VVDRGGNEVVDVVCNGVVVVVSGILELVEG